MNNSQNLYCSMAFSKYIAIRVLHPFSNATIKLVTRCFSWVGLDVSQFLPHLLTTRIQQGAPHLDSHVNENPRDCERNVITDEATNSGFCM